MTVRLIRVSVMLYAISFAHISCLMYSGLYAWKLLKPMVYFSLRKEPSMAYAKVRIISKERTGGGLNKGAIFSAPLFSTLSVFPN